MTLKNLTIHRICFLLCANFLMVLSQHRAPPGVNPNQYQQNQQYQQPPQQQQYGASAPGVPPQQYQQQQQHQQPPQYQQQQQQQQQYQQPPAQQQQFNAPQQPQHQGQGHHQHNQQQRVLHNNNLGEERDHIKDHLDVPLDTSGMSEEELQFHYFKMHDADNNNKLDGQELIKSLFHWHDSNNHDPAKADHPPPPGPKLFTDDELVNMIDPILDQDDKNSDGFIDYPEFVQAQRAAAAQAPATNAV